MKFYCNMPSVRDKTFTSCLVYKCLPTENVLTQYTKATVSTCYHKHISVCKDIQIPHITLALHCTQPAVSAKNCTSRHNDSHHTMARTSISSKMFISWRDACSYLHCSICTLLHLTCISQHQKFNSFNCLSLNSIMNTFIYS